MLDKKLNWLLVITMFMLAVPMAHSADLTNRQIENYIATLQEFNAVDGDMMVFEDDDEYSWDDIKAGPPKMVELVKRGKDHPDYSKFEAVVKDHGFKNADDWASVADRVNAAFMYMVMDVDRDEVMKQLASARKEIESIPGLSAAQKEGMLAFATAGMEMLSGWMAEVPEADLKAVKPYMQKLMNVMEVEDDD